MKPLIALSSVIFLAICYPAISDTTEDKYKDCLRSAVSGSSNLSADDIRSLCKEASTIKEKNELPLVNDKGWRLMIDANGNMLASGRWC